MANPFNKNNKKANSKLKNKLKKLKNEYKILRNRVNDRFDRMLKANEAIPNDQRYFTNLYMAKPDLDSISVLNERVKTFNYGDDEYIKDLQTKIKEAKAFLKNEYNSSKTIKAAHKEGKVGMMDFVLGVTGEITANQRILKLFGEATGFVRLAAKDMDWKYYDMEKITSFIDVKTISKIAKSKDNDAKVELIAKLNEIAKEYFK